jgi:hypothetical protein
LLTVALARLDDQNRTISLATLGRREDCRLDVRGIVVELVRRAVALLAAHHADIADDSPRLRYALECWTALNRTATDTGYTARPPASKPTN